MKKLLYTFVFNIYLQLYIFIIYIIYIYLQFSNIRDAL